ncbi:MAG: ABC transporter permease [Spongiibacteraceae bacterium]
MRLPDLLAFSADALLRTRFRSSMMLLAMGLGVAAVLILTALGEGARGYVVGEFAAIGKDVVVMFPGRKETTGGMPPVTGAASRDITLDEAYLLKRRLTAIEEVAPLVVGSARVAYEERSRDVNIMGTTALFLEIQHLQLGQGRTLSAGDFRRGGGEIILGEKLKRALFDNRVAIGEFVRVGDTRFRVVGILSGRGDAGGMDMSDSAIIPVAAAQRIFNVSGLFRVLLKVRDGYGIDATKYSVEIVMRELHQGELDVTLVNPAAMLKTFDNILMAMTLGVTAIGAISLLVAGILIMNIMLIAVSQRTREIGLLKALGASAGDILRLFLVEALLLTVSGAISGIVVGELVIFAARSAFDTVPFHAPLWAVVIAGVVAVLTGLAFSWLPARRASRLQPVEALQKP